MAGINVIFALLSNFFFPASLLIMLFCRLLVLLSRWTLTYVIIRFIFFGTLILSLLVNFAHIDTTLFFLLPILLSGLTFGLLIKKKFAQISSCF